MLPDILSTTFHLPSRLQDSIQVLQATPLGRSFLSIIQIMPIEVMSFRYKLRGANWSFLGLCRDSETLICTVCYVNDKGRFAERHGDIVESPKNGFTHRALFHFLGEEAQKAYGSYLDFTPHPVECIAVDHLDRTGILEPHAEVVLANDSDLRDYSMYEHSLICRMKNNVDSMGGIAMDVSE